MKALVTGGAGFLGSHLTDKLVELGHEVIIIDNLLTGDEANINPNAKFVKADIRSYSDILPYFEGVDWVFHTAAIARTPWTVEDPRLCTEINVTGTVNVLEAARAHKVKRVVHSSSCILYVPNTPYYASKLAAEEYLKIYMKLYDVSCIGLRYSNLYGKRQSEKGPSPNVFASFRKSKKETGRVWVTGDGEQSRDYLHSSDVVAANILAAQSDYRGIMDICTGQNTSLNEVIKYFDCPVDYIGERLGDIKHIYTDAKTAKDILGFEAKTKLVDGISDVL